MVEVEEQEPGPTVKKLWKWVGILEDKFLAKFAEFDGVQVYKRKFIRNGAGEDEKREYRCPHVGCPYILVAKRAAASLDFHIRQLGKHNCRGNADQQQEENGNNDECGAGEIEMKTREESPIPPVHQAKKRGRKREQKQMEPHEENEATGEPNAIVAIGAMDLFVEAGVDIQQQNNENTESAVRNILTARERCEQLQEMAAQLGLKFNGFVDQENYFITFDKKNADKIASFNNATLLEINIRSVQFGSNALFANLMCTNGVRGAGPVSFQWPIPDFSYFLWAVRGLCHETFVPSKQKANQNEYDDVLPEVEEPEEESSNGSPNAQKNFSIMKPHRDLRLEELAADLVLRLQRVNKDGTNLLALRYYNQILHQRVRLFITEDDSNIHLSEYRNGNKRGEEEWPKELGRAHFRFALIGVAVDLFGIEKENK